MAVISFTLYPAYISSVVIVGFLFNKSSLNLYFLVVQGLVLYLSLILLSLLGMKFDEVPCYKMTFKDNDVD